MAGFRGSCGCSVLGCRTLCFPELLILSGMLICRDKDLCLSLPIWPPTTCHLPSHLLSSLLLSSLPLFPHPPIALLPFSSPSLLFPLSFLLSSLPYALFLPPLFAPSSLLPSSFTFLPSFSSHPLPFPHSAFPSFLLPSSLPPSSIPAFWVSSPLSSVFPLFPETRFFASWLKMRRTFHLSGPWSS